MKRLILIMACLSIMAIGLAGCGGPARVASRPYPPPGQRVVIDIGIFYDEMAPYGTWFQLTGYGWVWTPYEVSVTWRPYTNGYWVWTDYGWTWVSRYRWGWGPFHYGRWMHHMRHGWVWIPGTVWGPGWVAWRHRPGWVGWAPLPPEAGWQVGVGLSVNWSVVDRIIEPHWYSFVEERYLTDRNLDRRIEVPARNVTYLESSRNVTRYEPSGNRAIDRGIDIRGIEQSTGRSIPRHRVIDPDLPSRTVEGGRIRNDEVILYRPNIDARAPQGAPRQATQPRRTVENETDLMRRQDEQRRRLEAEQAREREAATRTTREIKPRPESLPRATPEQIQRQHEAERRAMEQQIKREQEMQKQRQEEQRKAQPAPKRQEKQERKPPERKPARP